MLLKRGADSGRECKFETAWTQDPELRWIKPWCLDQTADQLSDDARIKDLLRSSAGSSISVLGIELYGLQGVAIEQ